MCHVLYVIWCLLHVRRRHRQRYRLAIHSRLNRQRCLNHVHVALCGCYRNPESLVDHGACHAPTFCQHRSKQKAACQFVVAAVMSWHSQSAEHGVGEGRSASDACSAPLNSTLSVTMNIPQSAMAMAIVHRLSHFVMWVSFLVFHTSLVCIFLLLAWAYKIDLHDVISLLQSLVLLLHIEQTWQLLVFWGLSGSTVIAIYVWLWRKVFWSFATPYLFKTIKEINGDT